MILLSDHLVYEGECHSKIKNIYAFFKVNVLVFNVDQRKKTFFLKLI